RVVGDARVRTLLATLDMAAERGGATGFDCRHDAELTEAQMPGILIAPCLAVAAEDIRHLQRRPGHGDLIRPAGKLRTSGVRAGSVSAVLIATRAQREVAVIWRWP